MNKIAFTLCSNNYLAQAKTLGDSILDTNSDFEFWIFLVDKQSQEINYSDFQHFRMIEVEKVDKEFIDHLNGNYDIVEINTAIKPRIFEFLFNSNPKAHVIYFDPDIQVFSSLDYIFELLTSKSIVLTPHSTKPIPIDGKSHDDTWFLKYGIFNLGFIAIKNEEKSRQFLSWWANRTFLAGKNDSQRGIFVDQKWVNLVPVYFPESYAVISNPAYNLAYWNLYGRQVEMRNDQVYIDNQELVFFHFSQFRPFSNRIANNQTRVDFEKFPQLKNLFLDYERMLLNNNYEYLRKFICYYQQRYVERILSTITTKQRTLLKFLPDYSFSLLKYFCNKFQGLITKKSTLEKYS